MFTWIPIHREAIRHILERRQNQKELLAILREMEQKGLKVISLEDKDAKGTTFPLTEIDPFTFLATFNRGITKENRRENWQFLKQRWALSAAVPEDFEGIPIMFNMNSWFFPFAASRSAEHIEKLWSIAVQAIDCGPEKLDQRLFDECRSLNRMNLNRLTIGLFWINPDQFLPADNKTTAYGAAKGIAMVPEDFRSYRQWMERMAEKLGKNYPEVSHAANVFASQGTGAGQDDGNALDGQSKKAVSRQYWTFSAGQSGENWQEFCEKGIIAIGWEGTSDLSQFKDKEAIRQELVKLWPRETSMTNDALACWQFAREIRIGDIIFAKQGQTKLLGYGVVEGDYEFDPARVRCRHIRKVRWLAKGEWEMPKENRMALKTLTDITPYPDFVKLIASKVGLAMGDRDPDDVRPPAPDCVAYWWLNANPKIWNFDEAPVGQKQTYTSQNEKGNKRQKYKYFQEVKPGDVLVGYVTSPQKEIVAVCRITKGLHQGERGQQIEFEKLEQFDTPVSYETLKANPDLVESEPLINNQGSLFKLSEEEYEIIRSLIDEANLAPQAEVKPYTKQMATKGLFLTEDLFDNVLEALKEKKNVVLQGAPGVGKTFVAKRLAYALIGSNDPQRIEMIQFHQSYSYEDFIQGFRPTPKGHFDLKCGVFYQFCRRAQREEPSGKPYVFIIDEINRGNLSKIFGELMMLIEPDKRGKGHAIPLAYAQDADEKFYIPANLYLLGMMNTADRSLAMVDYALRRRFRFMDLAPEFTSPAFHEFLTQAGAEPELVKKVIDRMAALNEAIAADTKNLGRGYQIGHSYFCPCNGTKPDEEWYRRVIKFEIVPLVREYWFDNEQKVKEQESALLA